ncbi:MAG TPA: DUF2093 domain-containing protein [Sphingomonas sp.]|jgi:hypothetical protein|uniref:DUF2093 domain-containing protein n=1 Tax=Sphingomonas sp. TaxID=28214 RepID=UPI002EDADCA9
MLMTPGGRPAKLHYMANNFRVLVRGDHVVCGVTGAAIPLDRLKYWSVDRQEPYATAQAATQAMAQG